MNFRGIVRKYISNDILDCLKPIVYLNQSNKIRRQWNQYKKNGDIKNDVMDRSCNYVKSLQCGKDIKFLFSCDAEESTLYSSIYACLIEGITGGQIAEKNQWIDYFNKSQRSDGYFIDSTFSNKDNEVFIKTTTGACALHLIGHITIVYDRLKTLPLYEFSFLKYYQKPDNVIKWLKNLDYRQIWASSNEIMNLGVAMQFSRDRMGLPYEDSLNAMYEFLIKNVREDVGMWFQGICRSKGDLYEAIRGAYHIIPLLYYEGIDIPYAKKAIDKIIELQNKWGGFDTLIGSGACEDIDAIDPLIRLSIQVGLDKSEIENTLVRARDWILFNQNEDGGFAFNRRNHFCWLNNKNLSSKKNNSNIFATWFRLLSLQLIENYLNEKNDNMIHTPGMECPLFLER